MKRTFAAAAAALALALTGCAGSASDKAQKPPADKGEIYSEADVRSSMESAGLSPKKVSSEQGDPGELLKNATVSPEECRAFLDPSQSDSETVKSIFVATSEKSSYFGAPDESGKKAVEILKKQRDLHTKCGSMKMTVAGVSVEAKVEPLDSVTVQGAEDVAAYTTTADASGFKTTITSIVAAKSNVLLGAVVTDTQKTKPDDAAKTLARLIQKL